MALTAALVISALLLWASFSFGARKSAQNARAPLLERLWFHAAITWPIVFKAALGSFFVPTGESPDGIAFTLWTIVPSLLFGFLILIQRARPGSIRIYSPGAIFLMVVSISLFTMVTGGGTPQTIIAIALFLPFALAGRNRVPIGVWSHDARISVLIAATVFATVAVISPEMIVGYCRDDKCSLSGYVLTSPVTGNGNFAGLALTLLLPWALLGLGSKLWTFAWSIGVLLIVEESGSRSALLAALMVAVTALLLAAWPRAGGAATKFVLLPGSLIASVIPAVVPFPPGTATLRGGLWSRARELIESSPVWGLGPSYWVRQPHTSGFWANYSAHNLWLDIAVTSGFIGIGLVLLALVWVLRSTGPTDLVLLSLALSAVLLLGILESPLQFGRIGITPFAALLFVLAGSSAQGDSLRLGLGKFGTPLLSRVKTWRARKVGTAGPRAVPSKPV